MQSPTFSFKFVPIPNHNHHQRPMPTHAHSRPPIAWLVLTHAHPCYSNYAHIFKNCVMCITRLHEVLVGLDKWKVVHWRWLHFNYSLVQAWNDLVCAMCTFRTTWVHASATWQHFIIHRLETWNIQETTIIKLDVLTCHTGPSPSLKLFWWAWVWYPFGSYAHPYPPGNNTHPCPPVNNNIKPMPTQNPKTT
jgi:hypothetical protein